MADVWTTVKTWSAALLSSADLNQYVRDNLTAIFNGLVGDASTDADIKHRHGSGVLSSRPTAGNAGRLYFANDRNTLYVDDGTAWRHAGGRGGYDTFTRANSSTLGSAESGHAWTENSGDLEINTSAMRLVSGTGIATIDTGAELETATYTAAFTSGATAGSVGLDVVLRYVDTSNFLYMQLIGTANKFRLMKAVAGVHTELVSIAATPTGTVQYTLQAQVRGGSVLCQLYAVGTQIFSIIYGDPASTWTPFAGATKCGIRMTYVAGDKCEEFAVVPNA